jgi:hypothetical protein
MAYYPDLSPYEYSGPEPSTVNVGWLAKKHGYSQGTVPDNFIERLLLFCRRLIHPTLGWHNCPFCRKPTLVWVRQGEGEFLLGTAEIRVIGKNGIIYAAPNLIYHYVAEHHYRPPEEFVQAVMEAPLPGSPEYEALVSNLGE